MCLQTKNVHYIDGGVSEAESQIHRIVENVSNPILDHEDSTLEFESFRIDRCNLNAADYANADDVYNIV